MELTKTNKHATLTPTGIQREIKIEGTTDYISNEMLKNVWNPCVSKYGLKWLLNGIQ